MPTIELWGWDPDSSRALRMGLFGRIFRDAPFVSELVVTTVARETEDIDGRSAPFVRVWDTEDGRKQAIVRSLQLIGVDVEVAPTLEDFVEGERDGRSLIRRLEDTQPVDWDTLLTPA